MNEHRVRLYLECLRSRAEEWVKTTGEHAPCLFEDLSFAEQWLDMKETVWAWSCVKNARTLARKLGIMRVAGA